MSNKKPIKIESELNSQKLWRQSIRNELGLSPYEMITAPSWLRLFRRALVLGRRAINLPDIKY